MLTSSVVFEPFFSFVISALLALLGRLLLHGCRIFSYHSSRFYKSSSALVYGIKSEVVVLEPSHCDCLLSSRRLCNFDSS